MWRKGRQARRLTGRVVMSPGEEKMHVGGKSGKEQEQMGSYNGIINETG